MFTDIEYTYLKNMVETYILKGDYVSYLAYTYTNISDNYSNESPEMYIIFSKSDIEASGNTFIIPEESITISIDTNSASRNSNNGPRYTFTESVSSVSVPNYEFIYSNAVNTKYADVLSYTEYLNSNNLSYNITKNEFYLTPLLVGLLIIMLFLKWCFPMKGGKSV